MTTFSDLGIESDILKSLTARGYQTPTPVQQKVIPHLLASKGDMINLAQTGTGKTAAFGLPLLQLTKSSNRYPQALILCPTRELCVQVATDLRAYAQFKTKIAIAAIYGGTSFTRQLSELKRGAQIIVATPGRLRDLIEKRKANLSRVRYVIFDEADEMLQMGFQDEINAILENTPDTKDTLLFSATMPKAVAEIAERYMHNPTEITVGKRNAGTANVRHEYYTVLNKHRYPAMKRILDNAPDNYSIIFCRTRLETQEVASQLAQDSYNVDALHGDLSQMQRDHVMKKFRQKNIQILVATDVAARGLDVHDLTHVINYNLPDDTSNYTHRSGRTGRAGKSGTSIAIITPKELYKIKAIERKIKQQFSHCQVPSGAEICSKKLTTLVDQLAEIENPHGNMEPLFAHLASKLDHLSKEELIKKVLSMQCGALFEYYENASDLNLKQSEKKQGYKGKNKNKEAMPAKRNYAGGGFTRLVLNVGKRDGVLPQRLIGTINDTPGGKRIRIGKIEILRNSAVLEAESKHLSQVLNAFTSMSINGRPVTVQVAEKKRSAPGNRTRNFKRGSKSRKSRTA